MARQYYKDSTTGQMKPLGVKVEDTLPVGTEVDYDGTDIPEGWVEVTDDYIISNYNIAGQSITTTAGLELGSIPTNENRTYIGSIIRDGNAIQGQISLIYNSSNGKLYLLCNTAQTFGNTSFLNVTHLYR